MDDSRLPQSSALDDAATRNLMLEQHRARLRQMVAACFDARLKARVDPSDVVQDALIKASGKLEQYLRGPPLPLHPWLRQIARECLIDVRRRHLDRQKRSVARERSLPPDNGATPSRRLTSLTEQITAPGPGPVTSAQRDELVARVKQALKLVDARSRQVLMLRHLEERSTAETAALLGISASAVKKRHLVAVQRLIQFMHHSHSHPEDPRCP